MKRTFFLHIGLLLLSLLAVTSCMEDEEYLAPGPVHSGEKIVISGEIVQQSRVRINDGGFCNGDEVGIYITDYVDGKPGTLLDEGNRADHLRHTYDEANNQWIPAHDIYWKDKYTHVDVYGFYPYADPVSVKAYAFEVRQDQKAPAESGHMGGYEASDFLWAKATDAAPTEKIIRLRFKHQMAGVRVTLTEGPGWEAGEWAKAQKQVLVQNTVRKSEINLADGTITPVGGAPENGIIPLYDGTDYRAVVVPQNVAAQAPLFTLTVNNETYQFKKPETFTYLSGKLHNFTIQVKKRADTGGLEFKLQSESITVWESDNVTHDATARAYVVINVEKPGTLKECIVAAGKKYEELKNLKVTGTIVSSDFGFMNTEMAKLQALNLKEVEIGESGYPAHEIPEFAFYGKESLMRIMLPDHLTKIGRSAFSQCKNLVGSLTIPEGVTEIGDWAFNECSSLTGTLTLPSTLKVIGDHAFAQTKFTCPLILPENLESLRNWCFYDCSNLYGELHLPHKLTRIDTYTFCGCSGFTGSLVIPEGIKEIGSFAFQSMRNLKGTLTLPKSLEKIGEGAFSSTPLRGELILPEGLTTIQPQTFADCDFSGELKLPESLVTIGNQAFTYNYRLRGTLTFPKEMVSIGEGAFDGCRDLEGLVFPEGLENIGKRAFSQCYGIGRIICQDAMPPYVGSGAFDGVPKDNFTLEVPEASIVQYQTAQGWGDFKRIANYRNFVCRPNSATAINTSVTRNLTLNSDANWTIESKPDWVTLDQAQGSQKTELKVTFAEMPQGSPNREGEIVFLQPEKGYRTRCYVTQYNYEYAEDQMVNLQTATQGPGINLVFLGDGYAAKDISEGLYMQDMQQAMDHFFAIEPYKTYRNYFTAHTGIAVSAESGIGGVNTVVHNRFHTYAKGGSTLGPATIGGDKEILEYACQAPTVNNENLGNSLIIMVPNTTDYGGICYMYGDGSAIAYCPKSTYEYPYDFRGIVQHEAGGHGFGKFADEYIYTNGFIDACACANPHVNDFLAGKSKGWYGNLSLSGKMQEVPWSHLIFHEKYHNFVDIFEGGYFHTRGVFRSEQNSCMNNNIPYYSTICRETIVKRIKAIAGETYSFDDFVANDQTGVADVSTLTRGVSDLWLQSAPMHQHSPVIIQHRPQVSKH